MPQTVPGFDRLTVEADKLGGQACIRGYRFSAEHLLELRLATLLQLDDYDAVHTEDEGLATSADPL